MFCGIQTCPKPLGVLKVSVQQGQTNCKANSPYLLRNICFFPWTTPAGIKKNSLEEHRNSPDREWQSWDLTPTKFSVFEDKQKEFSLRREKMERET